MSILPLVLEDVCLDRDGRRLLDRISVTFTAHSRTIVLGPNGAGKSLLLRLCHGLIGPTTGTVSWRGDTPTRRRSGQAMVFQKPVMLRRSVRANLAYGLNLRGTPADERDRRVDEALQLIGLTALAEQGAQDLSMGEQQRLALARAYTLRPDVLFLDEPTASLDPSATGAIERLIDAIHQAGTKIIMSTHDLGQARRLADEVLFLHGGRLVEHGPARIFFDGPESPDAAAFLEGRLLW